MQKISPTIATRKIHAAQPPARGFGSRLANAWRVSTRGLAAVVAGSLSLSIVFGIVPLLRLAPGDSSLRALRTQRAIHYCARFFLFFLRSTGVFRFDLSQTKQLREPGILVVANHPTLIDALVLVAHMPQAYCVVKKNFHHNAIFGPSARAAGYIRSEDGLKLVNACTRHLQDGLSVIIFPEGTRSPADSLGPFQRGAAHIAIRSGCKLVPVTIRSSPATLCPNQPWLEAPPKRPTLKIRVGDPIAFESDEDRTLSRARAARALTISLRNHFERGLEGD